MTRKRLLSKFSQFDTHPRSSGVQPSSPCRRVCLQVRYVSLTLGAIRRQRSDNEDPAIRAIDGLIAVIRTGHDEADIEVTDDWHRFSPLLRSGLL